jgi:hypothetical protein
MGAARHAPEVFSTVHAHFRFSATWGARGPHVAIFCSRIGIALLAGTLLRFA